MIHFSSIIKQMKTRRIKLLGANKEITVGDFKINNDGVFFKDTRDDIEQLIPVCSPLLVKAITRNKDGNDWGKVLIFIDPEGQEKTYHMASSKNPTVIISDLVHRGLVRSVPIRSSFRATRTLDSARKATGNRTSGNCAVATAVWFSQRRSPLPL